MNVRFNPNDFKVPHNPVVNCLFEYEPGRLGISFADGTIEKTSHRVGDHSPLDLIGSSCPLNIKLKWYESYVDGKLTLSYPFWRILKYDSESDFREDVRNESSTGWVERQLLAEMPERWHEEVRRYFD